MRIIPVLCTVLLLLAMPAAAAVKKVTFFLDGARVETEVAAVKGYLEMPLPGGMEVGSLRVRPLSGVPLNRIEVVPARPNQRLAKELAHLTERRDALADRLKALDVREEIFRAAAKSQSGKAPRKTKTNREPLADIRKGTEFAISQLEEVYRARRKAENELKGVEARLSALRNQGNVGGSVARIWVAGKGGRVAVSYLDPTLKWEPAYDFRVDRDGEAQVVLNAVIPRGGEGAAMTVVPALLAEASTEPGLPAAASGRVQVAAFRFPLAHEHFSPLPQASLAFFFLNSSGKRLPSGEATCYRHGEYLGTTPFVGCLPGESRELVFGKPAPSVK